MRQKETEFNLQVIVREWDEELDHLWEFRTFINDNHELTSCTQYYASCFVKEMQDKKKKIEELIFNFYKKIDPIIKSIGIGKYTMDISINKEMDSVQLIELNHCFFFIFFYFN